MEQKDILDLIDLYGGLYRKALEDLEQSKDKINMLEARVETYDDRLRSMEDVLEGTQEQLSRFQDALYEADYETWTELMEEFSNL